MNNAYMLGFVKRAQEYGLNEYQAIQLAKQANLDEIMNQIKEYGGGAMNQLKEYGGKAHDMWNGLDPRAQAAAVGAGLGGIGGAMIPSEDEEGETHRLRNALLGMGGGAAAGGIGAHYLQQALANAQAQGRETAINDETNRRGLFEKPMHLQGGTSLGITDEPLDLAGGIRINNTRGRL